MDVSEAGEISFVRKVSCEIGFDKFYFYVDGEEVEHWSGEQDWQEFTYNVTEGVHIFKWSYTKDYTVAGGDDAAWLDDIVFPIGTFGTLDPVENLTAVPQGDGYLIDWDYPGFNAGNPPPPGLLSYNVFRDGSLVSNTTETEFFSDAGDYEYCITAVYVEGSSAPECVSISTPTNAMEDFETGDFTKFPWQFGGDADWVIEANNPYDGSYSARSGAIGDDQSTDLIISMDVSEAGEISFVRKVSCEIAFDKLYFYIDGEEVAHWYGEQDWQEFTYNVAEGVHIFKWSYAKDFNIAGGDDAVWLDNIVFPDGTFGTFFPVENLTAVLQGDGYLLDWDYPGFNAGNPPPPGLLSYDILRDGILVGNTTETEFLGDIGDYEYCVVAVYNNGSSSQECVTVSVVDDIEDFETGDFSKFDWQFGGDAGWVIDDVSPYDGSFSARSGAIDDQQASELKITLDVQEPDVISFYKKVSSEAYWDWLRFYIDDTLAGSWTGETDWSQASFNVTAGIHTFTWKYIKDLWGIGGEDAAWLDNIVLPGVSGQDFLPPENPEYTVSASTVTLNWDYPGFNGGNPPPAGLQGYNIIRDDELIDFTTETTFSEDNVAVGEHQYCIKAVYTNGESTPVCITLETGISYYNLGGTILTDGTSIDEGFAYLYKLDDEGQIVDVFASFVSEYGYYDFYQLEEGHYILKAELSPNSSEYNQYIPTYYGDVPNWTNATVINLQANTWNADVNMIPIGYSGSGAGLISGTVTKYVKGAIGNVEILLMDEAYNVLEATYSDENGEFTFENLAFGNYLVMAEITGLHSGAAEVSLTEENPVNDQINFVVDDESIMLAVQELPQSISSIGDVFPNPANDKAHISFVLNQSVDVQYEVYDMTGNHILSSLPSNLMGQNTIDFDMHTLRPGVYFVKIHFGDTYSVTKRVAKY